MLNASFFVFLMTEVVSGWRNFSDFVKVRSYISIPVLACMCATFVFNLLSRIWIVKVWVVEFVGGLGCDIIFIVPLEFDLLLHVQIYSSNCRTMPREWYFFFFLRNEWDKNVSLLLARFFNVALAKVLASSFSSIPASPGHHVRKFFLFLQRFKFGEGCNLCQIWYAFEQSVCQRRCDNLRVWMLKSVIWWLSR